MPIAPPPAVARASVTITWNTRRPPIEPVREARVVAVHGTRVLLRFPGGATRVYQATAEQARALRLRIGSIIALRER